MGTSLYEKIRTERELSGKVTYENIPVRDMFPSKLFQRETKWDRINKMAATWEERRYEPITVCAHADGYSIIDGQHRYYAAKKAGIKTLYCRVLHGLSQQEEADTFIDLDLGRKPLTPTDRFIAWVQAGRPIHVQAVRLLREYGLMAQDDLRRDGQGQRLQCIATINRIIAKRDGTPRPGGLKRLEAILNLMRSAWGDDHYNYQGWVFRGLDKLYDVFEKYDIQLDSPQVIDKLKVVPLLSILKKAQEISPSSPGATSALMRAFLYFYNNRKQKKNRILFGGDRE